MPKLTSLFNRKVIYPHFPPSRITYQSGFQFTASTRNHCYRCVEIVRHKEMMIRVVRAPSDVGHQIPPAVSPPPPRCSSLPPPPPPRCSSLPHPRPLPPAPLPSLPPSRSSRPFASPRRVFRWRSVVLALLTFPTGYEYDAELLCFLFLIPLIITSFKMFKCSLHAVGCCAVISSGGFWLRAVNVIHSCFS